MIDAELRVGGRPGSCVSRGLFGGFVEHFGTGIYGGIWDSEADQPRSDVLAAVRRMGPTALRYPGGCFSDWYHWRDGVGDRAGRPTHERQFWTGFQLDSSPIDPELSERFGPRETNAFGTDEFLTYCNDVGAEPLLTANFGTGTPEEAAEWVAYTNKRAGSPRKVRWWFIGNEIWGPWELGHCSAEEYGARFREFSSAMREVDPEIRLIAAGNCQPQGYSGWNEGMLGAAGDAVDMVSVHFYFPGYTLGRELADNEEEFRQLLLGSRVLGENLDWTAENIDSANERDAPLPISLDEWNLWTAWPDLISRNHRLCDSVFYGGVFNRMIERADRVRFAMISHLVNCMAPIQTSPDGAFATAAALTFELYASSVRANRLPLEVDAPTVDVKPFPERTTGAPLGGSAARAGGVAVVDAVATADERGTAILACSGTLDEPIRATVRGLPPGASGRARWIDGPDVFARNDFDAPSRLDFSESPYSADENGVCTVELRPATVTALVFDDQGGH
jgi:alpha-L-arabinofuranosidase